jgi:Ni/Fe-hydrogenase subunit HybB-like protein
MNALPLIEGVHDDASLTATLFNHVHRTPGRGWWLLFLGSLALTGLYVFCVSYTVANGIGVWGNNIPVGWAFGIVNFVWWIGIGHAGTLISAILLLFQQQWRTSINRFAEAMTLFAVLCAAVYPLLHTGRPWFGYWLLPYPSTLGMWPNFRSPLVWDVFAISAYGIVSLLFWYLGLIPDLAALRDTAQSRTRRIVYGIFALGWRGSASHWRHWKIGYLLLAGISTPLVVSVHTIVSFDFATSVVPGWHTTIFPPYFVAGAVFSGFAMVITLIVPARKALGLEHVITGRHLENMTKVILATGMMVAYGYVCEHFIAWYSGNAPEAFVFFNRQTGTYAPLYWVMLFCNVLVPQIFWRRAARRSIATMWIAALFINVGMWAERFVIVVTSLHRDYLPSAWADYTPTWVDWGIFVGSMGLFSTLFLLFLRFVPAVAVSELKELRHTLSSEGAH